MLSSVQNQLHTKINWDMSGESIFFVLFSLGYVCVEAVKVPFVLKGIVFSFICPKEKNKFIRGED